MVRARGRSPKGTRLIGHVLHGHCQTTTFLAGLRTSDLVAPPVIDGAINGEMFVAYVKNVMVGELKPNDTAVLDNLSSHKRSEARQAIDSAGAQMVFLPPYNPDLNPIENAFAKFEWLLKSAKERTAEALWNTCSELMNRFTETECRNDIKHCRYPYGNL